MEAATEKANVSFKFDSGGSKLLVTVESPVGVHGADIKFDIPKSVGVKGSESSGFMSGAMKLSKDTVQRWVQPSANGEKKGTLAVSVDLPDDKTYSVTLLEVNLLDASKKVIGVQPTLPQSIDVKRGAPGKDGGGSGAGSPMTKLIVVILVILGIGLLAAMLMTRSRSGRAARRGA
jgi:hypothetical protein